MYQSILSIAGRSMKKVIALCMLCSLIASAQYRTNQQLADELQKLSKQSPHVQYRSIAKTLAGNDLWAVTVGTGETESKRALLIVGSIEASSLAGTEYTLRFIRSLAQSYGSVDSITRLLDRTTFYIIPRMNPDGAAAMFTAPLTERETNNTPFDDDRDGVTDEDGPEDLNNDGIISWMRVKDPRGEYIVSSDDPRIMKKADPSKGEQGMFRLFSEGKDNDNDDDWNEDPAGGTDLNRNFTYNYQFFGKNSGIHQMSEPESRAVADFVFDHPNIGLIFTFSSNDNLTTAWKNEASKGESPVISSVTKEDEDYFEAISKRFRETVKRKDAPKPAKGEGSFSEWGYYHGGRWSFAARPWWPGEIPKVKDTTVVKDSVKKGMESVKEEKDRSDDPILRTLKYYDAVGKKDVFVPWTKFSHPDFPDQLVEIGGLKPFAISNPPADSLDSFSKSYSTFLTFLAAQLPFIEVTNERVEKLGANVFRLTVDVVNTGFLPTNNSLGGKTRWVRNVRVVLDPGKGNAVSSGSMKQVIEPIKGSGGFKTLSWIIVGKGKVSILAESPVSGRSEKKVELK